MENNMEEKKNNQVQALDDDALENVAGGRVIFSNSSKKFYWKCMDCGNCFTTMTSATEKCESCGGKKLRSLPSF